jgi:hypothetical protein
MTFAVVKVIESIVSFNCFSVEYNLRNVSAQPAIDRLRRAQKAVSKGQAT